MSSTNSSQNSTRKLLAVMLLALFFGVTNVAHAGFFDFVTSVASAFQSQMAAAITSIASETATKVMPPVVKMTSNPTLTLTYDGKQEESALTARFNFYIKPSVKNINFRPSDLQILTKDKILGKTAGSWKSISIKTSLPINQDGSYTLLKDAQNKFEATVTYNPRVMEAGSYSTTLSSVVFEINGNKVISIVPSNISKRVTIVGEVSPQITTITTPVGKKDSVTFNGVRIPATVSVTLMKISAFDPTTEVKTFSLTKNVSGAYSFKVNDYIPGPGYYSLFITNPALGEIDGKSNTAAFEVVDIDSVPLITVSNSRLSIGYGIVGGEANLSGLFTVTVEARENDIYIAENAVGTVVEDGKHQSYPTTQRILYVNKANFTYPILIKAGTKAELSVVANFNPKAMFAGTYSARVYGLKTGKNLETFNKVVGESSNPVTIIGEVSPYITDVTTPIAQGARIDIYGLRFLGSSITIDGRAVSPADQSIADGLISFTAKSELLSPGYHTIKLTNPKGDSNSKGFEITSGPGSTNQNPVLGAIKVPTEIIAGKETNFTFSATDVDGDPLAWGVQWGDAVSPIMPCVFGGSAPQNNIYSASHTWSQPLQYKVTVTVRDCKGGEATQIFGVNVLPSDTTGTTTSLITVLSPVAGEAFTNGSPVTVSWLQKHTSKTVDLVLMKNGVPYHKVYAPSGEGKNIYTFETADLELPSATNYQMQICDDAVRTTSGDRYCSPLGALFTIATGPIIPPVHISATTTLFSANENEVSAGSFNAGTGTRIANDWRWKVQLNVSNLQQTQSKQVKSMTLYHQYGEGWSTSASKANDLGLGLYPLLVVANGARSSAYDQYPILPEFTPQNSYVGFDIYGQIESQRFNGGRLVIKFTDGTSVTSTIPPSSLIPRLVIEEI